MDSVFLLFEDDKNEERRKLIEEDHPHRSCSVGVDVYVIGIICIYIQFNSSTYLQEYFKNKYLVTHSERYLKNMIKKNHIKN